MSVTKEQVVEYIEQASSLDLSKLVKDLEDRLGVKVPIPQVVQQPIQEEKPTQDYFTVVLNKAGERRLEVIKAVKTIAQLGLREAKDLVVGGSSAC